MSRKIRANLGLANSLLKANLNKYERLRPASKSRRGGGCGAGVLHSLDETRELDRKLQGAKALVALGWKGEGWPKPYQAPLGLAWQVAMLWFERDKERHRFYLLPGMGGRAARRKRNLILKWTIVAGLIVSAVVASVLYLLNNFRR